MASIIYSIQLHENGKLVDITFLDKSKIEAEIQMIRRPSSGLPNHLTGYISEINTYQNVKAVQEHEKKFALMEQNYIPILVCDNLFALDMDSDIFNKNIIQAVT